MHGSRVAFEADLPRIEAADLGGICNRSSGANCVNPPPGANSYPIYTTGTDSRDENGGGRDTGGGRDKGGDGNCVWQLGGTTSRGRRTRSAGTRRPSTARCSSACIPAMAPSRSSDTTTSAGS